MQRVRQAFVGLVVLSLVGCSSDGEPSSDAEAAALDELQQSFNGPIGLMDFLTTSEAEEVRAALALYGMGYVVHEIPTTQSTSERLLKGATA